jgi:hypothetical protein
MRTLSKLGWFAVYWLGSVATLTLVASVIRWAIL